MRPRNRNIFAIFLIIFWYFYLLCCILPTVALGCVTHKNDNYYPYSTLFPLVGIIFVALFLWIQDGDGDLGITIHFWGVGMIILAVISGWGVGFSWDNYCRLKNDVTILNAGAEELIKNENFKYQLRDSIIAMPSRQEYVLYQSIGYFAMPLTE